MYADVLLVEPMPERLEALVEDLQVLDFQVLQVFNHQEAVEVVEKSASLALAVIDGRTPNFSDLFATIRQTHPDLPVMVVADRSDAGVAVCQPGILLHPPVTSMDLHTHAEQLLCRRLYPEAIVYMIRDNAMAVLEQSFQSPMEPGSPRLKANRNMPAPISAILSFCGDTVSGRIVISGNQGHLNLIYKRMFPKRTDVAIEAIEDLAGEIANQILGRIKAFFVRHDQPFNIASPLFLNGGLIAVRYKAGRPSLLLPFHESGQTLFLQFCFDTFSPEMLDQESAREEVPHGTMQFL